MNAPDVVARLRAAYESEADPERAAGEAAYLRHQFVFFGMRTADRRRLTSAAIAGLPPPADDAELTALVRALWAEPEREFQHAGSDFVRAHIAMAGPPFLDVLRELVTTKSWWDTVDTLATHGVGPLVRRHPDLIAAMDQWVTDDNLWVARTAILHQLTYKADTDEDRLFAYCRLLATHRDFFIRKAIGWSLRTYAATAPDAVRQFVATTPTLSPLSVREAAKGYERRAKR